MRCIRLGAGAGAVLSALMAMPVLAAAPPSVDATGCLKPVKTGAASTCGTQNSLSVTLKNTCTFAVRAQLCLRGTNHLWVACMDHKSLLAGDTLEGSTCDSDGDYTYWGCSKFTGSGGRCGGDDLIGKASNTGQN